MFQAKDIRHIEIELTTRCNAACPQCSRNYFGSHTWPTLPLVDLDLSVLQNSIEDQILESAKVIRLCGTYGDPLMSKKILDVISWAHARSQASVQINTNGSLRSVTWWENLAKILRPTDRVIVGIDGLEDTHALYRRGTDWKKIIRNIKAFNDNGGRSIWSFLIFEHNQHQLEQCRSMAMDIGCTDFIVKSTSRFVNKAHTIVPATPVLDDRGKTIYWLRPTTRPDYQNQGYDSFRQLQKQHGSYQEYLKTTKITCTAIRAGIVLISAEGYVLPCGWLQDRFYGYEAESHPDREKLFEMISDHGGLDNISLHHRSLGSIIEGDFFKTIAKSWQGPDRLERCGHQCGEAEQLIRFSTKDIQKVL